MTKALTSHYMRMHCDGDLAVPLHIGTYFWFVPGCMSVDGRSERFSEHPNVK